MSRLLLQLSDDEERTVRLRRGEAATLGRDSHHAIPVNDNTVSRLHARLTWREDGTCWLEDLQSSNGTTLNDALVVRPELLEDGDRLGFGRVAAVYLASDPARSPAREFAAGDLLAGRYRLERSLGETDEYETFCAADLSTGGSQVATTIFLPATIAGAGGFDGARQQFARVRAAPHPEMVRLLDFARWRGTEYLTSEWIEGRTLLDLLRRRGALALSNALRLAGQVAAVTDHARAYGLPPPDLSPRAVLLSPGEPLSSAAWEQILGAPVEGWLAFTVKIIPRLFAPAVKEGWPLGTLLCDLLGYPPANPGVSPPSRIACLGEAGNGMLARGFASSREAFGSDASFVAELATAVGFSKNEYRLPGPRAVA